MKFNLTDKMRCSTKVSATVITDLRIRGGLGLPRTIQENVVGDKNEGGMEGLKGKEGNVKSFSAAVISPPMELLSFPLLARLTNTLLASFNLLRCVCPPPPQLKLEN